ncbi:MAG TPA: hypothetical protein VL461_04080 [Dictyobacter sp.]|nr:hypothetical protein [Dictyobacter sp.]
MIGQDPALVERCLRSLQKGTVVCIEGRLVLTLLRGREGLLPLAEILAHDVIPLTNVDKQ